MRSQSLDPQHPKEAYKDSYPSHSIPQQSHHSQLVPTAIKQTLNRPSPKNILHHALLNQPSCTCSSSSDLTLLCHLRFLHSSWHHKLRQVHRYHDRPSSRLLAHPPHDHLPQQLDSHQPIQYLIIDRQRYRHHPIHRHCQSRRTRSLQLVPQANRGSRSSFRAM